MTLMSKNFQPIHKNHRSAVSCFVEDASMKMKSAPYRLSLAAAACIAILPYVSYANTINAETRDQLEYSYVHSAVQPHSYMAHYLGFAWLGGFSTTGVGEGMDVNYDQPNKRWVIRGNKKGGCSGYRCGDLTSIYVSNFNASQTGGVEVIGQPKIENLSNGNVFTAWVTNNSSLPQTVWINSTLSEETAYSSKLTKSFGLSTALTKAVNLPTFGGLETTVTTKFDTSTETAESKLTRTNNSLQANVTVPPYSAIPVIITMQRSKVSYAFKMPVSVTADIGYEGFMQWGGNALFGSPGDRRTLHYKFGTSNTEPKARNLRTQYLDRNIPKYDGPWDFNWMVNKYGDEHTRFLLDGVYAPRHANMQGIFESDTSVLGSTNIGAIIPVSQVNDADKRVNHGSVNGVQLLSREYKGVSFSIKSDSSVVPPVTPAAKPSDVGWKQLPGAGRQISTYGNTTCHTNSNDDIHCSDNGNAQKPDWFHVPGGLRKVVVSSAGLYGFTASGVMYHRANARTGDWVRLNGFASDIAHNPVTNEICIVGRDNITMYCGNHTGSSFVTGVKLSGAGRQISTYGNTTCHTNSNDDIYCSDNGKALKPDWFHVPGKLRKVVVSKDGLYGVGQTGGAFYYRANPRTGDWVRLSGNGPDIAHNPVTNEICSIGGDDKTMYCGKH